MGMEARVETLIMRGDGVVIVGYRHKVSKGNLLPLAALLRRAVDKKGAQSFKDCPVQRSF